ncbi:hypothetical protein AAY473_025445 [Plecturocebus cupreus]
MGNKMAAGGFLEEEDQAPLPVGQENAHVHRLALRGGRAQAAPLRLPGRLTRTLHPLSSLSHRSFSSLPETVQGARWRCQVAVHPQAESSAPSDGRHQVQSPGGLGEQLEKHGLQTSRGSQDLPRKPFSLKYFHNRTKFQRAVFNVGT